MSTPMKTRGVLSVLQDNNRWSTAPNSREKFTSLLNRNNERPFGREDMIESEATEQLDNSEIRLLHEQRKREQDEGLEEIYHGVKRVHQIGHDMNCELDRQDLIIKDIDRVRTSIIKIIEHRGTVVRELDNRKGHRKDAVRSQLTQQLTPEALAGLEEQLAASVGMSGPRK